MKAFKVIWQTFNINNHSMSLISGTSTIVNKEEYFITQESALLFIETKDKALRELQLNNGQLYMPTLHEVELK